MAKKAKPKAKRTRICRACNGQGTERGTSGWPCFECKGRKVV